jgi:uncharacterized protein involved in exopolysaccharide biosynthesis
MKQNTDANESSGASKGANPNNPAEEFKKSSVNGNGSHYQKNGHSTPAALNFWIALDVLANRWHWMAVGGILLAGTFFYLGSNLIKEKFKASGQLQRLPTPAFFAPTPTSPETFSALIRSPDLLRKVGEKADPPIEWEELGKSSKVDPQPDSDMVNVILQAREPQRAVALLNLYLEEAVEYTKQLQKQQASHLSDDYLTKQLDKIKETITALEKEFTNLAVLQKPNAGSGANTNGTVRADSPQVVALKLQGQALAKELNEMLLKFTEQHPTVIGLRERISELEHQMAAATTNASPTNAFVSAIAGLPLPLTSTGPVAADPQADIIRIRLLALQETYALMM